MRIVFYAINGVGVGHLTRLLSIAKRMRERLTQAKFVSDLVFITSSESAQWLYNERFPTFKVPSTEVVERSGNNVDGYLRIARHILSEMIESLSPDLLIVDSVPAGAFGEFLPSSTLDPLESCRRRALIFRPRRDNFPFELPTLAMLDSYDQILVPESEESGNVPFPAHILSRVEYVGPIIARDRLHNPKASEMRAALELQENALVVFVSMGGGGHPHAERELTSICRILSQLPCIHLIVAPGPLYEGKTLAGKNISWLPPILSHTGIYAADIAVSAAGYNSFCELMHLGKPTIFIPLDTAADDQEGRARRAELAGGAYVLKSPISAESLVTVVEKWRQASVRDSVAEAARRIVPENHTGRASRRLLELILPSVDWPE